MIKNYSPEPGLRSLSRKITSLCEHLALQYIKNQKISLTNENLIHYLGDTRESANKVEPGVSLGLGWSALGGSVMTIEAQKNEGKGLKLTGSLGSVM